MSTPPGMAETYTGVTYRLLDDDGHLIEQVTVPVGSYEDRRLGAEVELGESGWQLVQMGGMSAMRVEPTPSLEPTPETDEVDEVPADTPSQEDDPAAEPAAEGEES